MLKSCAYFCTLTVLTSIGYASGEFTIDNNGWIPVSPETVYNQIRRHSLTNVQNENDSDLTYDTLNSLVQANLDLQDETDIHNKAELDEEQNNLGPVIFQLKSIKTKEDGFNNEISRKAKKISVTIANREAHNLVLKTDRTVIPRSHPKNNMPNKIIQEEEAVSNDLNIKPESVLNLARNTVTKQDSTNIYEVTEDPMDDNGDRQNIDISIGHQHDSPKNQNFSSQLLDILSKYNIKSNDNLDNYQLSRQNKIKIPSKQSYQVPILVPYRFNSPNHLPIDPLFAVFLSNYGVYLPGLYGVHGNYNNLYGYLAANNIHNNKPFGLYKIFSDTDSSN